MSDARDENCKDMRELLSAYHDAELDAGEHRRVEEHLGTCSHCRTELEAIQSAVASLKSLVPVKLERDFADDIESLVRLAESGAEQPNASGIAAGHGGADTAGSADSESRMGRSDNVVPLKTSERSGQSNKGKRMWIAAAAAASVSLLVAAYVGTTGGGSLTVSNKNVIETPATVDRLEWHAAPLMANETGADASSTGSTEVEKHDSDPVLDRSIPKVADAGNHGDQALKPIIGSKSVEKHDDASASSKATTKMVASASNSGTQRNDVMPGSRRVEALDDLTDNEALLALSDSYDDFDIFGGISTDEDGLYAIKM